MEACAFPLFALIPLLTFHGPSGHPLGEVLHWAFSDSYCFILATSVSAGSLAHESLTVPGSL